MLYIPDEGLMEYVRSLPTFDSHEHLVPEEERLAARNDFTLFLQMYVKADLLSAGMDPADYDMMINDPDLSEEDRFVLFAPFHPYLAQSSYFRAARIAIKEFYGIDDITADTFLELGERIRDFAQPGLYEHVLRERCHLGHIINQKLETVTEDGLFMFNMHTSVYSGPDKEAMLSNFRVHGIEPDIKGIDDYEQALEDLFITWREQGVLAFKMGVRPFTPPDRASAEKAIHRMIATGSIDGDDFQALQNFCHHYFLDICRTHDYVMAVHTGPAASVWHDIHKIGADVLVPWADYYRDVRFDMYHMGIPGGRQSGFVAKLYPNVHANLCWAHVVAPLQTVNILDEWLDYVPVNKITGFGGDYSPCVEKVFGALEITRANLVQVMDRRIKRGQLDEEGAQELLQRILVSNGEALYGLPDWEE